MRASNFFETLPGRTVRVNFANVRACSFWSRCSSSPAPAPDAANTCLKLLSQLFGDRLQIANATGCSSIYGANSADDAVGRDADGRARGRTRFEDNAEFGLGYRRWRWTARAQARALAHRDLRRASATPS